MALLDIPLDNLQTSAAPAALPHANENDVAPSGASALSPFAIMSATLRNMGFSPIPIVPGTKRPAINERWQRHCDDAVTPEEMAYYLRIPNAGIGVALGFRVGAYQIVAVDIDVEDDDLDKLASALPDSPMEKRGAKGTTRYFKADPAIKTKRYRTASGRGLADLQAHGTQTVVAPSRHPSGIGYVWTRGPARADMLPILTSFDIARFEDACRALGWQDTPAATIVAGRAAVASHGASQARGDDGDVFRQVNVAALARFDSWVGELGMPKLKRHGNGRWEGVAHWRASGTNQPMHLRKPNLSFHPTGIKDLGTDQGYSASDVVMAAKGWSFGEAFNWLKERVMPTIDTSGFDGITTLNGASARREAANALPAHDPLTGEIMPAVVGATSALIWDDQDANAALETNWLIKKLLPDRGVALLYGASGSSKSFVTLEITACVITGHSFFGLKTKLPGGVLFALGEAAGTMPNRMNGLRNWRISGMTQDESFRALNLKKLPVTWLPVGNLIQPAPMAAFKAEIRAAAAGMLERHSCPLRLVFIDTAVASFGFADDPDATAVQSMMKQLADISQEMNLCFVVVHHAGKSKEAGAHGSYNWTGASDSVIYVDGTKDATLGTWSDRRLILQKEKNGGNEGWNRPFELQSVVLGIDDDDEDVTSAIVVPFEPASMDGITSGGGASVPASRFMDALWPAMAGAISLTTPDGSDVQAVRLTAVEGAHKQANPGKAASVKKKFGRDLDAAIATGLIGKCDAIGSTFVWPMHANDNSEPAAGGSSHALNA